MAEILKTGYNNISSRMIAEINRGEIFHLGVELYEPSEDEIFLYPERSKFRFSSARFHWRNLLYQNTIQAIPEMTKFIGKQFNNFTFQLTNVERGKSSGAALVLNNVIRGYRVAVRVIFPSLGGCLQDTRLVWWGRVSHVEEVNETGVRVVCSQEIGNFSYEIATQKYGKGCPLWFGRGECLGNETFEQKSALYQQAYNQFGQGGCNRTIERCKELQNDKFYQGQNVVTVSGQFIRIEIVKKKILWIFSYKKKNRIPVQWSSKNQSENDDVNIPLVLGRAQVLLQAFTWADIGTNIIALMGACKGEIDSFHNIKCYNRDLSIVEVTQHKGELGGVGSQQPDPRFPASGYNSRLAYVGITFGNSTEEDTPEEVPDVTAVVKGMLMPVGVSSALTGGGTIPLPPVVVPPPPPLPDPGPGGGGDPGPGGGGDPTPPFPGGCPRLDQWVRMFDGSKLISTQVADLQLGQRLWNPLTQQLQEIIHLEDLPDTPIWRIETSTGAVGFSSASHPIIRSRKDSIGTRVDLLKNGNSCLVDEMPNIIHSTVRLITPIGFGIVKLITLAGDRIYSYGDNPNQMIVCHNNKPAPDGGPILV